MKVYFNGSCNICNAEISHYKKKTCNINYVDISKNKDEHINHLSKKELFRRMHVYHDGKIVSGSESFLVLWDTLLLKLPLFRQLWKIAYEGLALLLYLKNKKKI
jgi:predicted DCC family thiol-disulfide oxidoreductase YuxK